MADKKFSELDLVGSLTGTEILPVIQEGLPKRTTVADVVANYVLKSGDTMTGQLTSQIVAPSADSTYTLGTSSLYWKETYTDKLFLNSTATLDGSTAGEIKGTGVFTADNIKRGTGFPEGVVTANVGTVYIDTAVTNGASSWIKKSGTGNTGWVVLEGDTGWRNVSSILINGWVKGAGFLGMRRVGTSVYLTSSLYNGLDGTSATNNDFLTIPDGFKISKQTSYNYDILGDYFTNFDTGRGNVRRSFGNIGSPARAFISFRINYTTDETWPTSLPGTAA